MKTKNVKAYNKPHTFRLSRKAVQKVAAVEGIDLAGDVQRELEEFDRRALTTDQRLAAIKAMFDKRPA